MTKVELDEAIVLYNSVMGIGQIEDVNATYVVRQWDGMDGCWCDDVTGDLEAVLTRWLVRTSNGTKHVSFSEIDYYRIFPDRTKMLYSGDNEMFR